MGYSFFLGGRKVSGYVSEFREDLRAKLQSVIPRLFPNHHGGEFRTAQAFELLGALGYRANRKTLDYCILRRCGSGYRRPPLVDSRLAWGIDNIVDFGAELESLRYWLPGQHEGKKTAFEKDAEAERLAAALRDWDARLEMTPSKLLALMVNCSDGDKRNGVFVALSARHPAVNTNAELHELCSRIVNEEHRSIRNATANVIRAMGVL